ncbi:MAG: ACT domain-containing protein [Acidimicrobiales bacterium]
MATDLVIEVDNEPGSLARVATAVSDGGVNISAATCTSPGERAQLHILVKHPEAAKHALATAGVTVTSEREVVVVEAHDRPGELADLTRKIAEAGINLDLVYVATGTRIVLGTADLDALRSVLGVDTPVPA